MQGWRPLWEPCNDEARFNVTIGVDLDSSDPLPLGSEYIRPTASIQALSHSDICQMSGDFGRCGRSIIGIMGPLLFCKLILSAFLTPSVVLWYAHLRTKGEGSMGRSSLHHARGASALKVLAMFGEIEVGDELEVNGLWADELEYLELVLIFTAAIPIILPLIIVIVGTNLAATAHLITHFEIEVKVEAKVESWVLWLALALQQIYIVATLYTIVRTDSGGSSVSPYSLLAIPGASIATAVAVWLGNSRTCRRGLDTGASSWCTSWDEMLSRITGGALRRSEASTADQISLKGAGPADGVCDLIEHDRDREPENEGELHHNAHHIDHGATAAINSGGCDEELHQALLSNSGTAK